MKHKALFIVVSVALFMRLLTSLLRITHGLVEVPLVGSSPWTDYTALYVPDLHFASLGYLPYRDFGFWYTPLFLYGLLPFYFLLGPYGPAMLMVFADALTAGVIYLIVARRLDARHSLLAGLSYALLPFVLYNEGYLWMSSQPMTFFALLSLYFLLDNQSYRSMTALAIAVLFKQEVIVLLPIFLYWQLKKGPKQTLKTAGLFSLVILIVSAPFLALTASNYLFDVSYGLVKTGPLLPTSFSVFPTSLSSPAFTSLSCVSTILLGRFTGNVCSGGNVLSLSWVVSQPLLVRVAGSFVDLIVIFTPLFFVLLCISLYPVRNASNFLQLISGASIIGLITAFQTGVSTAQAYYFVPFYALMLSVPINKVSLWVAIAGSLVAVFVPDGVFQTLLAIGILFALILATETSLTNLGARNGGRNQSSLRSSEGKFAASGMSRKRAGADYI